MGGEGPYFIRDTRTYLGDRNDIRLGLDGSGSQRGFLMRLTSWNGKGGREGDDIAPLALQGGAYLGESKLGG